MSILKDHHKYLRGGERLCFVTELYSRLFKTHIPKEHNGTPNIPCPTRASGHIGPIRLANTIETTTAQPNNMQERKTLKVKGTK